MSLRLWWALLWIDANMEHTSLQTSNLHLSIHPPCSPSPPPTPPPCLLFIFVHLHPPRRQTAPLCRPAADHARLSVLQMFTMFTQMLWRGHSMIKSQEVVAEFWPSTVLPHKMKWLSLRARKMSYSIPPIDITDCTKAEGGGKGVSFILCAELWEATALCVLPQLSYVSENESWPGVLSRVTSQHECQEAAEICFCAVQSRKTWTRQAAAAQRKSLPE